MWQSSSCHVQQAQDGIGAPEKYRNIEDTNLRRRHPEKQHLCVQPSQKLPSSKKDSPFKASMCLAWLQGFSTSNGGYVRYLCQVHLAHHLLRVISGSARAAPMAKCTEHFKNHDSSGGRRGVGPRQKARLFVTEGIWQRKPRFNKQGLYAWLWSGHLYILHTMSISNQWHVVPVVGQASVGPTRAFRLEPSFFVGFWMLSFACWHSRSEFKCHYHSIFQ